MDRLNAGKTLLRNQSVVSGNRKYTLIMQEDGNLVLYGPENAAWHTNTAQSPGNSATMQEDGNFVVYNTKGEALWHANSNRANFKGCLLITDEGKINIVDVVKVVSELKARE